jgi:hypothetical protein
MIVMYSPDLVPQVQPFSFFRRVAEAASFTSHASCDDYGPSACVWLVPGTAEE